jgi:hypothetical protein
VVGQGVIYLQLLHHHPLHILMPLVLVVLLVLLGAEVAVLGALVVLV